jgi:nitrite reductase/ring-hydroxylating ferredoxin subunit
MWTTRKVAVFNPDGHCYAIEDGCTHEGNNSPAALLRVIRSFALGTAHALHLHLHLHRLSVVRAR